MSKFGVRKILLFGLVLAGALSAQPPRQPQPMATQYWWESRVLTSLNLSEAQTKQLNAIQASYRSRLMDLGAAAKKAESNLDDVFQQYPADEIKADAAIDQYASTRDSLTRTLSKMSLQLRNVLTAEQWQELQKERPGPGRGRRGGPNGSAPNKATGPALSQK